MGRAILPDRTASLVFERKFCQLPVRREPPESGRTVGFAGRFTVASLKREDYTTIADLESRYADLSLGLADCALVVLAHRYETTRILSFDERHFRTVTPLGGGSFTLLPADG